MPSKNKFFNIIFSAYDIFKLHLHHFSKIKIQKESQNSRNQGFSYYFCMMMDRSGSGSRAGSGSGSMPLTSGSGSWRPKNPWIRIRIRIQICNTAPNSCITDFRNMQLAYIMVEREEAEVEDPWGDHQLPPDILPHTVR
jgi:hypothetical protein